MTQDIDIVWSLLNIYLIEQSQNCERERLKVVEMYLESIWKVLSLKKDFYRSIFIENF